RQVSISARVICPSGRLPNSLAQASTRLRSVRIDFSSGPSRSRYICAKSLKGMRPNWRFGGKYLFSRTWVIRRLSTRSAIFLLGPHSFPHASPVHHEANAPRIAALINGPATHTLQFALSSPPDLSFIVRSVSRCSARSCSILTPVCLTLVRSYAVSFGLVVLLSFGFVLVLLVITPFTQAPIPGKHGVSHATSFRVNIDGGVNLA